MKTMEIRCDACYGFGAKEQTILQDDGRFRTFKTPCPDCGGKGKFEYALFSIEEAKKLMERCGMDAKELES